MWAILVLAGCFSYPGVSCRLLTGPSITPEAGRNAAAGTFTFQRYALRLVKENSTEFLNGHSQCFSHRRLEINRCGHSSFTRTLFAFVCSAPELHLTLTPPVNVDPWKRGWSGKVKQGRKDERQIAERWWILLLEDVAVNHFTSLVNW